MTANDSLRPTSPETSPVERSPIGLKAPRSRRAALAATVGLIAALSTGTGTTFARRQEGTPDPAMAPGVTTAVLGSMEPPGAPGETLSLRRIVFAPGASLEPHTHPGATIYWIESGTLAFTLLAGEAHISRGEAGVAAATPSATEPVPVGREISVTAGDVLTFDDTAAQAERAMGDEPVVVLLTNLGPAGGPFRVPVEGTPVS